MEGKKENLLPSERPPTPNRQRRQWRRLLCECLRDRVLLFRGPLIREELHVVQTTKAERLFWLDEFTTAFRKQ